MSVGSEAVACDQCDQWYHIRCIVMHTFIYNNIDSKESWYCCQCGVPNFASSLFNSEIRLSDSSSNTTTSTRIGSVDSDDSFESPLATSSPNKSGRKSDNSSHVVVSSIQQQEIRH